MTSPASPPNRRRRRIVVTIAVLVLGLGWWFWPRVDQRFVARWRDVNDPGVTFELTSYGHVYLGASRPPPYRNVRIWSTWNFDGKDIHVGRDAEPSYLSHKLWTAWNWLTGEAGLSHEVRFRVDRIEHNRLLLVQTVTGAERRACKNAFRS